MRYSATDFAYGPVIVIRGTNKGRVGDLDDDTTDKGRTVGIVKFAPFGITPEYALIPMSNLALPNTAQLMARFEEIFYQLTPHKTTNVQGQARVAALEELALVSQVLNDRMFTARFTHAPRGAKIFISHSSHDKGFVRSLAVDLSAMGHTPWVDEWEILAGDSVPTAIGEGIEGADFVLVVLSQNAVASKWVENEWQAKYWTEITDRKVKVLPVLLSECKIPTLLQTKKYVDFRPDYTEALEELGNSISRHISRGKRDG